MAPLFALAILCVGHFGRSESSTATISLQGITTVLPRDLTSEEYTQVRRNASDGKDSEIKGLGKLRTFRRDDRIVLVWSGFLNEDEYKVAGIALRRLSDTWKLGEPMSLEGEPGVRAWLRQSETPDPTGKSSNDASVFRLSNSPFVTLTNGDRSITLDPLFLDPMTAAQWPMPKSKSQPQPEDLKSIDTGARLLIESRNFADVVESSRRARLATDLLAEWHRDHAEQLRSLAPGFFTKAEEDLRRRFGGTLPIGRDFNTLQDDVQNRLSASLAESPTSHGFKDKDEALEWLSGASVTKIRGSLEASVPQFWEGGRSTRAFPITLPRL